MTIMELDTLATKYDLWEFEVDSTARRRWMSGNEFYLRRKIGSIGVIIVRVDMKTLKLIGSELVVKDEKNDNEVTIELTEQQLKDLTSIIY